MRYIVVMIPALLAGGVHAQSSCQALADKVSKEFQVAHNIAAADKTAKCRAYAMVTMHMDDMATQCTHEGDLKIAEERIKPMAQAMAADEERYCSK